MKNTIIACDDGYFPQFFKGRKGRTVLACIKTRNNSFIVGIAFKRIIIDGRETTPTITDLVKSLKPCKAVLLDGITYAGFDVADAMQIHEETQVPVITVQQYPLNLERIKYSLRKHFPDWTKRYEVISRIYRNMYPLSTRWKTIEFSPYGMSPKKASKLLLQTMIYSPIPEPLRIADHIASQISRLILRNNY
ncbi:DUF99 family protein [Staphylothermus hellenicus]|uniref:UPF0215 protein Shell_0002 n=1 Tax=Staphylothermus hellenicus (strain DSM 12710 / JCM 10830 / BK20S6-10-b1 / P8) TaxID=591019 RepID=D7DAF8_STAHD|nr:DUF99 family protein [Staphylothermus hellenicus]ADI31155.1 protein of unknown function DUF99 [Staphylothermus hellenicus DSM 12710]